VTTLLLGLDAGTSAVKAAVIDDSGAEVAHGRAPTPWETVPTGAEIDPDALLTAALAAAAQALDAAPEGQVAGIGVASMAETGVLLDDDGRPAAPAIAWHDERGAEQAERIAAELPGFPARTGLPASRLCTLAKYAWMREQGWAPGARWLNVAEWIVFGLGGEPAAELSLASRTGFYDLHAQAPWHEALAWAGAPLDLVDDPVPAGTPMGEAELPRARGALLTVAGHDHLSAAVGAGAAGEGDVLDSCGTAEAFVRATAPRSPEQAARAVECGVTVGWHAAPGRQALLGAQNSGAALRDLLAELGVPVEQRDALEAAALEPAPESREAAAYRDALESFGAGGAEILARMNEIAGQPHRRLVVTGGWAEGVAARAVKARHLGPFEHSAAIFTGARGAALAAGRAAGLWNVDDAPHGVLQEVS
jgi:sugar (pentulose or hexulose) kinase